MQSESTLLGQRIKELREKNNISQEQLAEHIHVGNKSSISRVESGNLKLKKTIEYARKYCEYFQIDEMQRENLFKAQKIAVPDTSALLCNPQLIDSLADEYMYIIIASTVLSELNRLKDRGNQKQRRVAWQLIHAIGNNTNIIHRDCSPDFHGNNDRRIVKTAEEAALQYGCLAEIITNDVDFSAILKADIPNVTAIHLPEYQARRQELISPLRMAMFDSYFALSYEDIDPPSPDEANAYLGNGLTLIISTVRNQEASLDERKAKIKWLIKHGADINKVDNSRYYFPALTHAIQAGDFKIFQFMLDECNANPNQGNRNPYTASTFRRKNEGNMPLMVAAWEGRARFVKALCRNKKTSINQQDGNGFTALIKASANRNRYCREILLSYGADKSIVDFNGLTSEDHYKAAMRQGPLRSRGRRKSK